MRVSRTPAALIALAPLLSGGCFLLPPFLAAEGGSDVPTPVGKPGMAHCALAVGATHSGREWAPAETVPYASVDGDRQLGDSPLWASLWSGIGYSDHVPELSPRDQGSSTILDFGGGLRHYQAIGPVEPFVGAGVALYNRGFTYDDNLPGRGAGNSVGAYVEAGIGFTFTPNFAVGALARHYYGTDLSVALIDFDGDHDTFQILFEWRR